MGLVDRFKPSFQNKGLFVPRFMQLTESMLVYYGKTHQLGYAIDDRQASRVPLFSIPLSQIHKAKLLNQEKSYKICEMARRTKLDFCNKTDTSRSLFELKLRDKYENLHIVSKVNDAFERNSLSPER